MDTFLLILGWTSFGLAVVVGLALNVVGLFGNWLILLAMTAAWLLSGYDHFGLWGLGVSLGFAVVGEILEFALAGYGARRYGGSKGAMVAALVGCIVGAIVGSPLFPIIGTVIGACAGAFAAAAIYEYIRHEKSVDEAMRTGMGAAMGKIGGMVAKFSCGLAILATAWFTFSPGT
jgi:uncharacterized protein YqgC (DUF456 family)